MKKFKDLLQEKYINDNKEYFFMLDGRIPLAPKLWSRINKITKVPVCWHSTNAKGALTISKIQKSNKQISCFTESAELMAMGIETSGGILVELKGDTTLKVKRDAWTSLDRNGLRWCDLSEVAPESFSKIYAFFTNLRFELQDLAYKIFREVGGSGELIVSRPSDLSAYIEEKFTQEQKREFIKIVFDEFEKVLTSSIMKEFVKNINITADLESYNEVVLHNFTIKKIYRIEYGTRSLNDRIIREIEKTGIKIDGKIDHNIVSDLSVRRGVKAKDYIEKEINK